MTLYAKINNIRNSHLVIKIMLGISILISLTCIIINICIPGNFFWAFLVIAGIVYTWVTVMYSIKRNINIASNVFMQTILISILTIAIDIIIGYRGWSLDMALPIIISVANITLLLLTIVSTKKYYQYALYQVMTFLISILPFVLLCTTNLIKLEIFTILATFIATVTLIFNISLCGKNIKEELIRRLHL